MRGDEALYQTLMVRSAVTPRVSNHEAVIEHTARTMHARAWEVSVRAVLINAGSALRFRGGAVEFGI